MTDMGIQCAFPRGIREPLKPFANQETVPDLHCKGMQKLEAIITQSRQAHIKPVETGNKCTMQMPAHTHHHVLQYMKIIGMCDIFPIKIHIGVS